jgi:putative PIN family toxin of toxin-antitoxin system
VIVAVLDTNVLASAVLGLNKADSTPGELWRRWRAKVFHLVVSEPILSEQARTLKNPYFAPRLTADEVATIFAALRAEAHVQPITVHVVGAAAHAQDDLILATALSANAPYIVTGDKPLLAPGAYRGTRMLTARPFLDILDRESRE